MQKRGRRFFGYAGIAVGRTCDHAFEQSQYATHLRLAVQRRDEMHFRCAWVGKTNIYLVGKQGVAKVVGAIHVRESFSLSFSLFMQRPWHSMAAFSFPKVSHANLDLVGLAVS